MKGWNAEKYCAAVCTQNQPIKGIANWKSEKIPETPSILFLPIVGSLSPLAKETENASIASPTPSIILVKKNEKL